MVVGGLEQTGILKVMANFIGDISNGNLMLMIAIILWISAIASAFVDNIPFAATMIPIISSLSAAQGVELSILAWALAWEPISVEAQLLSVHLQMSWVSLPQQRQVI